MVEVVKSVEEDTVEDLEVDVTIEEATVDVMEIEEMEVIVETVEVIAEMVEAIEETRGVMIVATTAILIVDAKICARRTEKRLSRLLANFPPLVALQCSYIGVYL